MDASIKARRIEVDARQGVVTLRGEVASDDERAQALILARTTEGVQRVEDALTVNAALTQALPSAQVGVGLAAPSAAATQDAALTRQIEAKLTSEDALKNATIDVVAKGGVVLLEGTAPTAAAKQRVLSLVRETKGVLQVVDRLKVGR
jgi:osmotically-inducible protein OsmY